MRTPEPKTGMTTDPDLNGLAVLKRVTDEENARLGPVLERVTREENERFLAALSTSRTMGTHDQGNPARQPPGRGGKRSGNARVPVNIRRMPGCQ